MTVALFLPGITTPAHVAFAALLTELDPSVEVVTKELEVYAGDEPPEGYGLETELDGLDRFAAERGHDRFHLYGHSIGGAVALAYTARHGERVASLALNEAATDFSPDDRAAIAAQRLGELPEDQRMAAFVRQLVRPGVEISPPPPAPSTPEMAKRPAGLAAAIPAVESATIDHSRLREYAGPVYYSYGTLSNARWEAMGERLASVFADCTVERYEGRHHLNTSHQAEPARVAAALRRLWARG
ncbi:MAG TPA: alpha/beta fold hydrolase [Pseudonocardia sp.]